MESFPDFSSSSFPSISPSSTSFSFDSPAIAVPAAPAPVMSPSPSSFTDSLANLGTVASDAYMNYQMGKAIQADPSVAKTMLETQQKSMKWFILLFLVIAIVGLAMMSR